MIYFGCKIVAYPGIFGCRYIVLARGSTPDFFVCDEPVNDDKVREHLLRSCAVTLNVDYRTHRAVSADS